MAELKFRAYKVGRREQLSGWISFAFLLFAWSFPLSCLLHYLGLSESRSVKSYLGGRFTFNAGLYLGTNPCASSRRRPVPAPVIPAITSCQAPLHTWPNPHPSPINVVSLCVLLLQRARHPKTTYSTMACRNKQIDSILEQVCLVVVFGGVVISGESLGMSCFE